MNYLNRYINQVQGKISPLLGYGQCEAVALADLVNLTGLSERTVRKQIQRERQIGIPILSDNYHGYYLPCTEFEADLCVRSLRRRAMEIRRTASAIERGMNYYGSCED